MMRHAAIDILLRALGPAPDWTALSETDWDVLLRLGRASDLLARVAQRAFDQGYEASPRVEVHLRSSRLLAARQHRELALELQVIDRIFAEARIPLVVLKGSAYALSGLQAAAGRMVSDIDLMVPTASLPQAESALMMAGWVSANRDAYDQRYYRTWMHEIPPMRHIHRGTVIDLHHNILPPTGRIKLDAGALLQCARPLEGFLGLQLLAPHDMVLHSAAHLTHEGELDTGLRGLVDLDALVRELACDPTFMPDLHDRAIALGLGLPLFQALRVTNRVLGTPLPAGWLERLGEASGFDPDSVGQRVLAQCWSSAVLPRHSLVQDRWAPVARSLLYLRGHWLRMPPDLLLRHLARKAVRAVWSTGDRHGTA